MNGTVLATLGEGRFGKVCCIRSDDETNSLVAVKQYDRQKSAEMGRVNRILQEKAVLQSLSNPYICRYIDTAKDDTTLFIVMEAVLGGPLHRHIQINGGLPLPQVQLYFAQMISCCEHMAKRGCIHRDIKASNCVLDEKGHIKLCDFGCSKILFPSADFASVVSSEPSTGPRTRSFVGSHHIMPIEMLQGEGYGVSVDWWAIGVLLFEMITGKPPFDNVRHFVQESPSSTLSEYDWNIPFDTSPPFDSLKAKEAKGNANYSAPQPHLSHSKQLISDILNPDLECRKGIWNVQKIKNSPFFSDVDFSFIDQGVCAPVTFDRRVGYLEIVYGDDTKNDKGQEEDEISEKDQLLFDAF